MQIPDFSQLAPDTIASACQSAIDTCDATIAAMLAVPAAERTFANTLLALEEAYQQIEFASGTYAFMAYVSPDEALRDAARAWDERLDKYLVGLGFREDIYAAVREFASTAEAAALEGEDARLLERTLRDYRRNGFDLEPGQRNTLRRYFDELVELGNAFPRGIDDWDDGLDLTREDLDGLPESFIGGLKEEGGRYRVSLAYPEFYPFISNATNGQLRKELFEKEQSKGGEENVKRLERALELRQRAAEVLGYDSWAAYAIEPRMADSRETVAAFLDDLRDRVAIKADADLRLLSAEKVAAGGDATVNIWDWRYCHNLLMKNRFAVDDFQVAEYFPLDACIDGLFGMTQQMLGIRYEPVDAPTWHSDVRVYDICNEGEATPFARFYMDLFPRPSKYGHAAAFTIRRGRTLPDGSYQQPASAIVANFTKPSADQPSLLRHSEVIVFFHEFGHILHQTLTKTVRARFSGSATERDFVEAPSQMLEHWCWEPEVLRGFARHYQTGEPLTANLLDAMVAAKNASSGIMTLRQLFFAMLDLAYHSPGYDGDSTALTERLHDVTGFPYPPGTHFQSGFGHLFGYDAGYYGYLWSHVFGDDMYTRFEEAGPLNPEVGRRYRELILERGGAVDGSQLVRDFLGREPNNVAFLRGLGLESI